MKESKANSTLLELYCEYVRTQTSRLMRGCRSVLLAPIREYEVKAPEAKRGYTLSLDPPLRRILYGRPCGDPSPMMGDVPPLADAFDSKFGAAVVSFTSMHHNIPF